MQTLEGKGNCLAWAATAADEPLAPFRLSRRPLRGNDVQLQITYCGICHTDIHLARDEWRGYNPRTAFPIVPGHEVVGVVTAVGSDVTKFNVGDIGAIGFLVDACCSCDPCKQSLEQHCQKGAVTTTNAKCVSFVGLLTP